jgi:hypothetical protein
LKISGVWFKECENRLVKRNRRVEVEFRRFQELEIKRPGPEEMKKQPIITFRIRK